MHPEKKDQVIKEIHDHIKEAQHVIAHIFHDNKERERKLAERVSDTQTPQDALGSKKESISKIPEGSKEKESMQSPKTVDLIKPTPPLARSLARKITYDYKIIEETQAKG